MPSSHIAAAAATSRRSVLLAAAAVAVCACTAEPRSAPSPTPRTPEPDDLLRQTLITAEEELIALYAATLAAHPALAPDLAGFESRHRQHLTAVESSGPVAPRPTPSTSTPPLTPPPVVVAPDPQAALTALRAVEDAAAEARVQDCLRCSDPVLAELVASIAAGEAANGVLLPADL